MCGRPVRRRQVEIFSAGCPLCEQTIHLIQRVAGDLCDITIFRVRSDSATMRARALGIRSFPAVVVDGELVPFDFLTALSQAFTESEWIQQFLNEF
jgi:glutaredoxin 3